MEQQQYPQYERQIGLRTIWLTILRRFVDAIVIFVPIALASFIVTQKVMTKSFTSSTSLSINGVINATQYAVIKSSINTADLAYTVTADDEEKTATTYYVYTQAAANLVAKGVNIKPDELYKKISLGALATNSASITISFTASDSALPKKVLDEVAPLLVTAYKQKRTDLATMSTVPAGNAVHSSKENTYLLVGLAVGLVLGLGFAFLDEILSDEVYNAKDINNFGGAGFDLKVSK